jgi:hypothetical protein
VYDDHTFTVTLSPRPLAGQWALAALLKQYLADDEGETVHGKLGKVFHKVALAQLSVGSMAAYSRDPAPEPVWEADIVTGVEGQVLGGLAEMPVGGVLGVWTLISRGAEVTWLQLLRAVTVRTEGLGSLVVKLMLKVTFDDPGGGAGTVVTFPFRSQS